MMAAVTWALDVGDGEADAFDGKRAFENYIAREFRRDFDPQPVVVSPADRFESQKFSRTVHMTLHDVATQAAVSPHRELKIHVRYLF